MINNYLIKTINKYKLKVRLKTLFFIFFIGNIGFSQEIKITNQTLYQNTENHQYTVNKSDRNSDINSKVVSVLIGKSIKDKNSKNILISLKNSDFLLSSVKLICKEGYFSDDFAEINNEYPLKILSHIDKETAINCLGGNNINKFGDFEKTCKISAYEGDYCFKNFNGRLHFKRAKNSKFFNAYCRFSKEKYAFKQLVFSNKNGLSIKSVDVNNQNSFLLKQECLSIAGNNSLSAEIVANKLMRVISRNYKQTDTLKNKMYEKINFELK